MNLSLSVNAETMEKVWQWKNPFPQGNNLNAIWGNSNDEMFAVGNLGTLFYYNGRSWTEVKTETNKDLNSIWGSSPNNIFVVGHSGTILHFNGNQWLNIKINST